jgi:hypothetical protein
MNGLADIIFNNFQHSLHLYLDIVGYGLVTVLIQMNEIDFFFQIPLKLPHLKNHGYFLNIFLYHPKVHVTQPKRN